MIERDLTCLIVISPRFVTLIKSHQSSCSNPKQTSDTRQEDREYTHNLMVVWVQVIIKELHYFEACYQSHYENDSSNYDMSDMHDQPIRL